MTTTAIDLLASFSTDKKAEQAGTPTLIPGLGDTKFLLARTGNVEFNKLMNQLYKKHRAVLESKGQAAQDKSEEIMAEVYARTILLGWEGEVNMGGVPTKYSYEAALRLCGISDLRELFQGVAADFNTFKVQQDEADAKN